MVARPFRHFRRAATRALATLAAAGLALAQPAAAQQGPSILRDAETEALFADMARPLIQAAGLSPANVNVVLINDDSINAFVVGGQTVYVHSGLLFAADNINEVQGVVAHELGHIADGHVAGADAGARPAMGISILSLVLGIAAAAAAGGGEAAAGIMSAGQQAALGKYLAFTRTQEATADASGMKYLRTAGISGRGMLSFFKKLQQQEYRYGLGNIDPFMQTHPLSGDRLQNLTADIQASPAYANKTDSALDERFKRVKAKLEGYAREPARTFRDFPDSDQSIYAHYARAYAYHKAGYPDKADAEAEALVKAKPDDPYFREVQGQILLEAGNPKAAIGPLRIAAEGTRNNPLVATTLGHALIATEDKANYPEALRVLRQAVARDDDNLFAWYQLGTAYELTGDSARAALATAETASLNGDSRTASQSARAAMMGIPQNTPDWIRAQDIAMTSQNDLDDKKRKKKVSNRALMLGMVILGLVFGAGGMWLADHAAPAGLAGADKARVEATIHDYLLANPEVIPAAMQRLQDKSTGKLIAASRADILTPYGSAWIGNPKGDVTLVEYLDYNCTFCRASLPTLDKLVAADPKLRIVFRELPVLAESSRDAARVSLAAAQQGKWKRFHDLLYAAGPVTAQTIAAAAQGAGVDAARIPADADAQIKTNLVMASKLGMTGTPSWVVGDRVLQGALPLETLQAAIADARAR